MVWDVHPDRLTETPDAMTVIGQENFISKERGGGQDGFGAGPSSLYYDITTDRLFVSDATNNRILMFDVSPENLETGMAASLVIGQQNFDGSAPGLGEEPVPAERRSHGQPRVPPSSGRGSKGT